MPYILWHYILNYNIDVLCSFLSCTYASFKISPVSRIHNKCFFFQRSVGFKTTLDKKKTTLYGQKHFTKYIFSCSMEEKKMGLGLEMHEGKYMITGFSFLGKLSPSQQCSTLVNSQCR